MIKAGDEITWKGYPWVVLDTDCNGGVLILMKKIWKKLKYGNEGIEYSVSAIREILYKDLLPELGEENLIDHEMNITYHSLGSIKTITDKIFILNEEEYTKYKMNQVIPLYSAPWWLCDTYIDLIYKCVNSLGNIWSGDPMLVRGIVPACVVRSEILKSESTPKESKFLKSKEMSKVSKNPQFMKVRPCAEMLGWSTYNLRKEMKAGRVKYMKVGNAYMIDMWDLRRNLQARVNRESRPQIQKG